MLQPVQARVLPNMPPATSLVLGMVIGCSLCLNLFRMPLNEAVTIELVPWTAHAAPWTVPQCSFTGVKPYQ